MSVRLLFYLTLVSIISILPQECLILFLKDQHLNALRHHLRVSKTLQLLFLKIGRIILPVIFW
jgi:hypothetical protein